MDIGLYMSKIVKHSYEYNFNRTYVWQPCSYVNGRPRVVSKRWLTRPWPWAVAKKCQFQIIHASHIGAQNTSLSMNFQRLNEYYGWQTSDRVEAVEF